MLMVESWKRLVNGECSERELESRPESAGRRKGSLENLVLVKDIAV